MNNLSLEERLAQMGRELKQELSAGQELSGGFFNQMGKLFVEQLLGAEVSDALGRSKSQRRSEDDPPDGMGTGYRNGYKSRSLLNGEGRIEVQVPQVRNYAVSGQEQSYRSAIWAG
jgi:transposase-like protein